MVGFMAGSIVSKMLLDTTKWSNSIKVVKGDEGKLKGMAAKHAESFRKVGRAMTIAGAAIVTGLTLAVNKAGDAQETFAKFDTIFEDVGAEAEAMATALAKGFGLSEVAAKDMLGATGDLLTGLGMGSDVALDLSVKTQQLAVDLASFTNFSGGAKGAADALTKAMLGENESVKALGITIRDSMVMEQLAAEGKDKLTGLALQAAKAEAVLTLAVKQSENAIGDYARTSDSLVNQKRLLAAQTENLVVTLGTHLIPIYTKIVTGVTSIVTKFNEWAKANPKLSGTLIKIAAGAGAFLAVAGPIVMMIPKLVAGMGLLKTGIATLGKRMLWFVATPAGLIIVALAAITIGFLKVKDAQKKADEAARNYNEVAGNLDKKLLGIAERAGLTADEFENLKEKYKGNTNAMVKAIRAGEEGVALQESMIDTGKKNNEIIAEQKAAIDATLPSLSDLAGGMDTVGSSAFSMGTKIKDYSIPAIMQLELDLISLKDEYDSHNLTLDEYIENQIEIEKRLKKLKGGWEEVELAIEDTDIEIEGMGFDLNAMVLSGIEDLGDLSDTIGGLPKDFVVAARKTKTKVNTWWKETTDGMKTKWGNMWSSFLKGPISLKSFGDAFKTFTTNIKDQFLDMLGTMIAKWTTEFLGKLVTGTTTAVSDVVGSLKDIGKGALDLAKGFSPAGMIATGLGAAVGTFLGGLLGPKGPSANDTRLIKDNTWATNQNVVNLHDAMVLRLDEIKTTTWHDSAQLNDIKLTLWDQTDILRTISGKLGTAPTGTGRTGRGGTPSTGTATNPAGINIGKINQSVNINGIMISERNWARETLIPEIFHALKQRALKRQLQSILGMG